MVKLNRIYTRTGDNGTTGLAAGPRRKKSDLRVEAFGAVDEANELTPIGKELAKLPLESQPGTDWAYGPCVDLQGYVIQKLSGKSLDRYFQDHIFDPLKMPDTQFWVDPAKTARVVRVHTYDAAGKVIPTDSRLPTSPPRFLAGGGGLFSTAPDYFRFCQALLQGGELDGARVLKPETVKLMRKSVRKILTSKDKKITITPELLEEFLGPAYFRTEMVDAEPSVGAVTGLAWTSVGGETLTIEAIMTHGKGRMTVTGNLQNVMKESISAANSFVRARAVQFGVKPPMFRSRDIHVHVPEGATPKDGPSAGIAMVTAIVSVLTGVAVRSEVAMTGEVTLRGRVLPIGGLKEKLLAAHRGGLTTVLIPEQNVKDLADIPDNVKNVLEIRPVKWIDEVLAVALERPQVALVEEVDQTHAVQ